MRLTMACLSNAAKHMVLAGLSAGDTWGILQLGMSIVVSGIEIVLITRGRPLAGKMVEHYD
jgi:hypothetical protein